MLFSIYFRNVFLFVFEFDFEKKNKEFVFIKFFVLFFIDGELYIKAVPVMNSHFAPTAFVLTFTTEFIHSIIPTRREIFFINKTTKLHDD